MSRGRLGLDPEALLGHTRAGAAGWRGGEPGEASHREQVRRKRWGSRGAAWGGLGEAPSLLTFIFLLRVRGTWAWRVRDPEEAEGRLHKVWRTVGSGARGVARCGVRCRARGPTRARRALPAMERSPNSVAAEGRRSIESTACPPVPSRLCRPHAQRGPAHGRWGGQAPAARGSRATQGMPCRGPGPGALSTRRPAVSRWLTFCFQLAASPFQRALAGAGGAWLLGEGEACRGRGGEASRGGGLRGCAGRRRYTVSRWFCRALGSQRAQVGVRVQGERVVEGSPLLSGWGPSSCKRSLSRCR